MKSYTRNIVIGLFALTAISATISGVFAKPPQRIFGTTYATPSVFRFMVTLGKANFFEHTCGGAIISPRHILTAAHCLPAINSSSYVVRSGIHNLNDATATVSNPKSHFIHPNYVLNKSGPMQNDIGIILLDRDLYLSGAVYSINLPTAQPDYDNFYNFFGWGATGFTTFPADLKMATGIRLLNKQECLAKGGKPEQPQKLCGFKPDATLCSGDSGSPLVTGQTIVGIASSSRCIIGAPHTYTNVYHYLDWINDIVNRT